jgi:hypothetical protein
MTDPAPLTTPALRALREKIERIIDDMRAEYPRYQSHPFSAIDSVASKDVDVWADQLEAALAELEALAAAPPVSRALLVKADSYLSLVLHRHLKPDTPDDLRREIDGVVGELRAASALTAERSPEAPQLKPPSDCAEAGSKFALTGDRELLNTIDGKVWAEAFCRITGFKDEGWALAWFCNAIMAGYDEATRRAKTSEERP